MKQCERRIGDGGNRLSPLARSFTFDPSSSLQPASDVFSSVEPYLSDDSVWGDCAFDLSFLSSDDQKSGVDGSLSSLSLEGEAITLPKGSQLYGQAAYASETKTNMDATLALPVEDQRVSLEVMRQENVESVPKLSTFLLSDLRSAASRADSQPQVSLATPVIPTDHFGSEVTLDEGCSKPFSPTSVLGNGGKTPAANVVSTDNVNSGDGDGDAEGQPPNAKDEAACFGKVLANRTIEKTNDGSINKIDPSPFFSKMSELQIRCPSGSDNDKLDLHSAKPTVLSEKSSVPSDHDDSEVDSPCWRGTQSYNTVATASKSMGLTPSSDDLNGFHRLNPLAPHFVPANAKKSLDKHVKDCGESSSSSLQKSLSSTFPLSSGACSLVDPFKAVGVPLKTNDAVKNYSCGETDKARGVSILPHTVDKSADLVSHDSFAKAGSKLDSSNEFQTSKRLDPLAPNFVPASAKLSAAVHEKKGGEDDMLVFETNAPSTSALSSLGNGLLNNVTAETCSAGISSSFWDQCSNGVRQTGLSYSFNPWLGAEVGISENVNLKSSGDELHGRHKLNPLAPEFLLAGAKQNLNGHEKNLVADYSSPVMNTAVSSTSFVNGDLKVMNAAEVRSQPSVPVTQAQSSVYMDSFSDGVQAMRRECVLPNKLHGGSSLPSSAADRLTHIEDHFASSKQLVVWPKTMLSTKGIKEIGHRPSFHVSEDAVSSSSTDIRALSDFSQKYSHPSSTPSTHMDVKKLLATMHGLSEFLTLVQGHSCDPPILNEQELVLVNNIVKNLKSYVRNRTQGHARNDSNYPCGSYNPKQLANPHKLLIRDLQPSRANETTVNTNLKRKEKYSMVFDEMIPDLSGNGAIKGNGIAEVIANSALQGNHQFVEQMNSQELLYRSLWHKAEAELCLMKYEACLSQMKSEPSSSG